MARRARFFTAQIEKEKDEILIRPLYDCAPLITVGPRAAQTIDELDVTLAEYESRLLKMNDSYQTLNERAKELIEARYVLRETAVFFDRVCKATYMLFNIQCNIFSRPMFNRQMPARPLMRVLLHCFNMMITRPNTALRTFVLISSKSVWFCSKCLVLTAS